MLIQLCFAALTVRFLTRRFIGEYGDIGMLPHSLTDLYVTFNISHFNITSTLSLESLYTHNVVVDGREQTLNIWDAPYSQVSQCFRFCCKHFFFSTKPAKMMCWPQLVS